MPISNTFTWSYGIKRKARSGLLNNQGGGGAWKLINPPGYLISCHVGRLAEPSPVLRTNLLTLSGTVSRDLVGPKDPKDGVTILKKLTKDFLWGNPFEIVGYLISGQIFWKSHPLDSFRAYIISRQWVEQCTSKSLEIIIFLDHRNKGNCCLYGI